MSSGKDLKIKLVYMGFGGMIAIIGMSFAVGMLSSVTAQNDKFDTIQCSRLEVVDEKGNSMVALGVTEYGGRVVVMDKDRKSGVTLGIREYGSGGGSGSVRVYGNDGKSKVRLDGYNDGSVVVRGKYGETSIWVNAHGGSVDIRGKDGKLKAVLAVTEHGGSVEVAGKDEGAAVMGINEFGNGVVWTRDKNGYRQ